MELELKINGRTKNITQNINSFNIQEHSNGTIDHLELELDNRALELKPPSRANATIELLVNRISFGVFFVLDIMISENSIRFLATSANLSMAREKHSRSFSSTTLGSIINTLSNSLGVSSKVSSSLQSKEIDYFLQSNQTDLQVLEVLSKVFNAITNIKNQKVIFIDKASNQPSITLKAENIYSINKATADMAVYNGAKASYFHAISGEQKTVICGKSPFYVVDMPLSASMLEQATTGLYQEVLIKNNTEIQVEGNPQLQVGVIVNVPPEKTDFAGNFKVIKASHHFEAGKFITQLTVV